MTTIAQPVRPGGFVNECVPCRRPLGQFVPRPANACQLATEKGNVLSVRVLALRGAKILTLLSRPAGPLLSDQLQRATTAAIGDELLRLAEQSPKISDNAQPGLVWSSDELERICSAVTAADEFSRGIEDPALIEARERLFDAAAQIQEALAAPGGLKPTPIAPGKQGPIGTVAVAAIALGAAGLLAGTVWFFTRRS